VRGRCEVGIEVGDATAVVSWHIVQRRFLSLDVNIA
jgi:hypothetical protein